jgi:hypothetical protein
LSTNLASACLLDITLTTDHNCDICSACLRALLLLLLLLLLLQLSAAGAEVGSLRGEVGQLVSLKEAAEQDMARLSADLAAVSGAAAAHRTTDY